jgi:hypothetical protein
MSDRHTVDSITSDQLDQLQDALDGAYCERAHLVALLAAMTEGAVIAPAVDVDEPGWQIAYLNIGGSQASWHIAPRDAGLFRGVDHVAIDDPRAQWDGHTTDEKYARIRNHTRVREMNRRLQRMRRRPEQAGVCCSAAFLLGSLHGPHEWQPQPGMDLVHCPGGQGEQAAADGAEPPVHIGGKANAENCPACRGTNPPYPFLCPGPDTAAVSAREA